MTRVATREVILVTRKILRDSDKNQYRTLPANNLVLARLHVPVHNRSLNLNHNLSSNGHGHSDVQHRLHLRVVPCFLLPTRCTTLQTAGSQKLILPSSFACHLHTSSSARVVRPPPFIRVLILLCAPCPKILYLWYQSLDLLARRYIRSLFRTLVPNERYVGERRVRKAWLLRGHQI